MVLTISIRLHFNFICGFVWWQVVLKPRRSLNHRQILSKLLTKMSRFLCCLLSITITGKWRKNPLLNLDLLAKTTVVARLWQWHLVNLTTFHKREEFANFSHVDVKVFFSSRFDNYFAHLYEIGFILWVIITPVKNCCERRRLKCLLTDSGIPVASLR